MGIIIYDEVEKGRYKFNDKNYEKILEIEGEEITERRINANCSECKNNLYNKEIVLDKKQEERYKKLEKEIERFIENIKEILKIEK